MSDSNFNNILSYLAADINTINVANTVSDYLESDNVNSNDKDIQCDLLTEDEGHRIDPTRLTYKERIRWHLKEFCYKTSSHGIPMLGQAPNLTYRIVWLNVFDNVMIRAGKVNSEEDEIRRLAAINDRKALETNIARKKRAGSAASFEPAMSDCNCEGDESSMECETDVYKKPLNENITCLCAFDRESGDAWPCYPRKNWEEHICGHCDEHSYCTREIKSGFPNANQICLCQSINPFCVAFDKSTDNLKLWEYYGGVVDDAKIIESLGFQNMSDEVAIVTKAKENIIFAMSELSEKQRMALSIQKHQLIHKCSFNGMACDIDRDFKAVSDPTFGNCFTFNHNKSQTLSSIRAGPMYGLRILVYVNVTEYLSTTEAVGVRITVHDKDEYPFPDTFGYSAPTGYISSFGMKMTKMSRLPAPYGDCVPDGLTSNYIYSGYRYSTEGCYRSCFQDLVVRECGCGDPRFPVLNNSMHCQVFDPIARKCLEKRTNELGNVHGSFRCRCQQPCVQSVYTVSYSAAIWPSQSLNISLGNCHESQEECNEQYM
uniref:Uncharacterized protein n=1 Tax=Panagrolaimus sp. ES5 TaxID=591445 RepID=A0AC34GTL3_9BILA